MKIEKYILSSEEEGIVTAIYERVKQYLPEATIQQRSEIIGIGEKGKYLFCYFTVTDDVLHVKFKNGVHFPATDNDTINTEIERTRILFTENDLKLPRRNDRKDNTANITPHHTKVDPKVDPKVDLKADFKADIEADTAVDPKVDPKVDSNADSEAHTSPAFVPSRDNTVTPSHHTNVMPSRDNTAMPTRDNTVPYETEVEILLRDYAHVITKIPAELVSVNFDTCSVRLKNALYRAHVNNVGDLSALRGEDVIKIRNLGRTSFRELCEFLHDLASGRFKITTNDTPTLIPAPTPAQIEHQQKLNAILQSGTTIAIDPKDARVDFVDAERLATLYNNAINHICDRVSYLFDDRRDGRIFLMRMGIIPGYKTLADIGDHFSISRERVRQILQKDVKKMLRQVLSPNARMELEYQRTLLSSEIRDVTAGAFVSYLIINDAYPLFIDFLMQYFCYNTCGLHAIYMQLGQLVQTKKKEEAEAGKIRAYNEAVYSAITFPGRARSITDADFARLKYDLNFDETTHNEYFQPLPLDGATYYCESFTQRRVLDKLLSHGTFKKIKLHSLRVPYGDTYILPDFQCLTHDNRFVLIDVHPVSRMYEHPYPKKIETMREYCKTYGFGYAVIDDRLNSYEHINEENQEFFDEILNEIDRVGYVNYPSFKGIRARTNATTGQLLTLIKRYNLCFTTPFRISYPEAE